MNSESSFLADLLLKGLLLGNSSVEDINTSPCIADSSRIKYMAKINRNLADVIPTLYLSTLNSQMTRDPLILSFTTQQHNFLLGEKGDLAVTYVKDMEQVDYINHKMIELINKGIKYRLTNRANLDALVERKKKLTPMTLHDIFPKTDCKECGEASCFNYAAKITTGEARYDACPYVEQESIKSVVTPVDLAWSIELT